MHYTSLFSLGGNQVAAAVNFYKTLRPQKIRQHVTLLTAKASFTLADALIRLHNRGPGFLERNNEQQCERHALINWLDALLFVGRARPIILL